MQNKNMEDKMRESLKGYPSSLDKATMYQDFEKIYVKESNDKGALLFIFFGLMMAGVSFWMLYNNGVESNLMTNSGSQEEKLRNEIETSAIFLKERGFPNNGMGLNKLEDAKESIDIIVEKKAELGVESEKSSSRGILTTKESSWNTEKIVRNKEEKDVKLSNSGLYGSGLKLGAIKVYVDGAPTHNKYTTNALPESAIALLASSYPKLNVKEVIIPSKYPESIVNLDYEFSRSRWGFRAGFLSLQDIKTAGFFDYQTVDHLFLSLSVQQQLKNNFSIEPTLSYGKYNIYQEGSVNLPLQFDTISTEDLKGMISDYVEAPEVNDTINFDRQYYGSNYDLYSLNLGINLLYQLHLGKNWYLETAIGPTLSWNIKSSGSWSNQSKSVIIEDYGIVDSKRIVLMAVGRLGFQKLYDNHRTLSFGLATQMDITDRRKEKKSLDRLQGVGFYLGMTAGF